MTTEGKVEEMSRAEEFAREICAENQAKQLREQIDRERQSRQSAQEQLERYKAEVTRLEHLLSAAQKDANRYRWLSSNSKHIKWIPSNYNKDVVSGFSAFSTGYLGFGFEEAIDAAIAAQGSK